jgi:hypothetical protein
MVTIAAGSYDSTRYLENFRPVRSFSNQTLGFLIGYYYETPILRIHG